VPPITLPQKAGSHWAAEIRRIWAEGKFQVIELAKAVPRAKLQLRRGEWTALWLDSNVPFSQRKAEMLVVIGTRLGWANPQTFAHLPQGWSILYYLARMERVALNDLIARGVVHPCLTLSEAKDLLKLGPSAKATAKLPPVSKRLNQFSTFVHPGGRTVMNTGGATVHETFQLWSEEQRRVVQAELEEILSLIPVARASEPHEASATIFAMYQ
jgi:hypothetical protein